MSFGGVAARSQLGGRQIAAALAKSDFHGFVRVLDNENAAAEPQSARAPG